MTFTKVPLKRLVMENRAGTTYAVQVKPNAKIEKVEEENWILKIWTKEPAKEGKANEAVIKLLAKYFKVTKRQVEIKSGFKSKQKVVQIKK